MDGGVNSKHQTSCTAIAEMCIGGRTGAAIDIDGPGEADLWGRLWGESLGRIIVGVKQIRIPHSDHQGLLLSIGP